MEELEHAEMLAERIVQLGGTPLIRPKDWYDVTNCGYEAPEDEFVVSILEQNIEGERCAIRVYKELIDNLRGKDDVTVGIIANTILPDEIEHEEDLEAILEDIELM